MPPSVIEKVNSGIKQTIEGAISMLTPHAEEKQKSPETIGKGQVKGTTGLAPESAAQLPAELFVSSPPLPPVEQVPQSDRPSKKQERERKSAERKARHEAKRDARRQKNKERKEKRREAKERKRKEKQWKKAAKDGGDLPVHIIQGLRTFPGTKTPYHPKCEICKTSAAPDTSIQKQSSKCPTCAKATERKSTQQFLKTSNVDPERLPSFTEMGELLDLVKGILLKHGSVGIMSTGGSEASGQARVDEELAQHIVLHIRDLIASCGEADCRKHKCNPKSRPGHAGRHGLDGNRDSPTSTDGGQIISNSIQNSDSSTTTNPAEADWWIQAMSLNKPASPYRTLSPRAGTPLPR